MSPNAPLCSPAHQAEKTMAQKTPSRKRLCRICGKWFVPDPAGGRPAEALWRRRGANGYGTPRSAPDETGRIEPLAPPGSASASRSCASWSRRRNGPCCIPWRSTVSSPLWLYAGLTRGSRNSWTASNACAPPGNSASPSWRLAPSISPSERGKRPCCS